MTSKMKTRQTTTMATSISLTNFVSFLSPPSKPAQTHLPLTPPSLSLLSPSQTPPPPQPKLSLTLKNNRHKLNSNPIIIPQNDSHSNFDSLSMVVCPSLSFANTLFFKSGYNVQVIVGDHEDEEQLIGRFRREVLRAGIIQESKRRRFFEDKREEKKRKNRQAAKSAKRNRKSQTGQQSVQVKEKEPEEKLIGHYVRDGVRAGIIIESTAPRLRFFHNKRDGRRVKICGPAKLNHKRHSQAKASEQDKHGGSKKKGEDEKDDNWDFIDGDIPYT